MPFTASLPEISASFVSDADHAAKGFFGDMGDDSRSEVTRLLKAISDGDAKSSDELLPLVYEELRKLAAAHMVRERPGQTLQPTALVHEAYLRLLGNRESDWSNRGHFFGAAAQAMRRILVEQARKRGRIKRGGDLQRVTLEDVPDGTDTEQVDFLVLDEALRRMEVEDERMARVVMLRFFAGLSIEDTAEAMGISPMTVKREWACAKAWLHDELNEQ